MTTGVVVLKYPDVWQSFNLHARGNPWDYGREKKKWGEMFEAGLVAATRRGEIPARVERVKARAILTFYDRGSRDEDNFKVIPAKCLGDALDGGAHSYMVPDGINPATGRPKRKKFKVYPDGRWLVEDNSDRYKFASIEFAYEPLSAPPQGMSKRDWRAIQPRGHAEVRLRWWA